MKKLQHVKSAICSTPWAINKEWLDAICEIVETHANGGEPRPFVPMEKRGRRCPECKKGVAKAVMQVGAYGAVPTGNYQCRDCGHICEEDDLPPYEIINGAAILPLDGPLFPRANLMTQYSGATSYAAYGQAFSHAMQNPDVNAIIPLAHSPGGSCLMLADTCSLIYRGREAGTKPIIGLMEYACSAAYGIMSQCDQLYIVESGLAGNIGTRLTIPNWDRAERNEGNDPIEIASNDIKATGVPKSLAQYQSLIDTTLAYFEQFKEIVIRGRKGIDIDSVADAKTYIGKDAVRMGLADGVSTLEEIIQKLN